ncbi:hypothetical protein NBM05_06220 [Rothia sp. AR01]|uniref:Abi-like protein n=1 Tax=Rothia santali TaxID=2949643 RepID=A0A9X2KHW9_9MICC|nr:hypothetical protein [Rothia santali]MCP3425618.1 hypothetical protein [Rothia santali]
MYDTLEPHLSIARLASYVKAAEGNRQDAIRLYQWNTELSGAVYQALHVVEVVLRNAMDTRLRRWNAEQINAQTGEHRDGDWLLDPAPLLRRLVREKELAAGRGRAERAIRGHGRPVSHADVLAQLSFGTWRFLLPDRDPGRKRLWNDALEGAFPHRKANPRDIVKAVDGVYKLRNRVAHLEPLLDLKNVRHQYENMRWVLRGIDPVVDEWFVSRQRVTAELRRHPRKM